jgi:hypothetical protein
MPSPPLLLRAPRQPSPAPGVPRLLSAHTPRRGPARAHPPRRRRRPRTPPLTPAPRRRLPHANAQHAAVPPSPNSRLAAAFPPAEPAPLLPFQRRRRLSNRPPLFGLTPGHHALDAAPPRRQDRSGSARLTPLTPPRSRVASPAGHPVLTPLHRLGRL